MNIGPEGLALIKEFEGVRLEAYLDSVGVPTIGYGHTKGVQMGDTCTEEEAEAWLREDLAWAEECVESAVTAFLHENEHAACVSLCFNIGCKAFTDSTLVRLINEGDFDGAGLQFHRWNKQAGKVLAGLTRRRAEESQLFETV